MPLKKTPGRSIAVDYKLPVKPAIFNVVTTCTRATHPYIFVCRSFGGALQKIGQIPSYGDVAVAESSDLLKLLTSSDRREFTMAIRLFSSDVFIGAFVYMRRLFERMIDRAWQTALSKGANIADDFKKLPMDGKVRELRAYLPPILVRNLSVWSILSAGVHELTEENCQRIFPAVRAAIEQMLEQEAHTRRARELEAATVKAIQGIVQDLGKR